MWKLEVSFVFSDLNETFKWNDQLCFWNRAISSANLNWPRNGEVC